MEFDFEATSYITLCGFVKDYSQNFSDEITAICKDISSDIEAYIFNGTDENGKKRKGVHKGRVLKKIFETIQEPQQQALVLLSFDNIMGQLVEFYDRKNAASAIGNFLKEAAEILSPTKTAQPQA